MPCLLHGRGDYNKSMKIWRQMVLLAWFCLTLAACGGEPAADDGDGQTGIAAFAPAQRPRSGVQAEVALFSGRPNPQWALSETDIQALWAMLAALEPVGAKETPGNLGYQGFRLHYEQPGTKESGTIAIFDGFVYYSAGRQTLSAADPERRIERWLATVARQHLDFTIYMALPEEVRSAPGNS